MATKAPESSPDLYVVLESFLVEENGAPAVYRKGEIIHPDDPHIKLMPTRFGAFEFPHPVKRRGATLTVPEVRS